MGSIEVDGSQGEGGGQILRSALAFSVIRGVPVRVTNVRAGREAPGLKRQHVSTLRVLASVFGGTMEGAAEGSTAVRFAPGKTRLEEYNVDMGTAASITLVLQAVIPAVAVSGSGLRLGLKGGTDVPWSPTFDYFRSVAIPGYRALGIEASIEAARRGYYPRGGGRVVAEVRPCRGIRPIELTATPGPAKVVLESRCGSLGKGVAERQARSAAEKLRSSGVEVGSTEASEEQSDSPGTSVAIHRSGDGVFLGSDSIGARGRRAEEVGAEAAERYVRALGTGGSMDAHVADMVIPLLSLAPGPSRVRVEQFTPHLESGLRLAEQFTSCRWSAERDGKSTLVSVLPPRARGPVQGQNV